MRYAGESRSIASLPGMSDRTVILYTFSKKFAMTGWRLGAAVAPVDRSPTDHQAQHQRRELHHPLRAGRRSRGRRRAIRIGPRAILAELQRRRDAAWRSACRSIRGFVVRRDPTAPSTCSPTSPRRWPRWVSTTSPSSPMRRCGPPVCRSARARHFGRPLPGEVEQYVRFAYSGISVADIELGLGKLREWIEAA